MKEKQSENLPLKNSGAGSVTDKSDVKEKYPWHLLLQTVVLLNAFLGGRQIDATYNGHMWPMVDRIPGDATSVFSINNDPLCIVCVPVLGLTGVW